MITSIARSGERSAFTPSDTTRSASMSRPESVSSRISSDGSKSAICRISIRFFSPPEKPTFSGRFSMSKSMRSRLDASRTSFRNAGAETSSSPRARFCAFSAVRTNVRAGTPGISIGYWNDRNTPLAARSAGSSSSKSSPFQATDPSVAS